MKWRRHLPTSQRRFGDDFTSALDCLHHTPDDFIETEELRACVLDHVVERWTPGSTYAYAGRADT